MNEHSRPKETSGRPVGELGHSPRAHDLRGAGRSENEENPQLTIDSVPYPEEAVAMIVHELRSPLAAMSATRMIFSA
jgi:hypothetical protein